MCVAPLFASLRKADCLIVIEAPPQGRCDCRECYWHSLRNNLLPFILAQPLLYSQFPTRHYGMPEARSQQRIP